MKKQTRKMTWSLELMVEKMNKPAERLRWERKKMACVQEANRN